MKKFYGIIVVIIAAVFMTMTIFAVPAAAQTIKWRLVSCWPAHSFLFQVDKHYTKNIYELSGGRLQITVHPAGELVSTSAVFDTVSKGAAEMGSEWATYWAGKNSAFDPLGSITLVFSQHDTINWYFHAGGREIFDYMYGKYNLIYFPTAATPVTSGIRSRMPIRGLADLKGKKIRIPGKVAGYIMQKAGAVQVMVAPGEIAQALATGALDGSAFNTPLTDLSIGLDEVTKYNIGPGWNMPSGIEGMIINKDAWNTLPPDLKKIIEIAANDSFLYMSTQMEWGSVMALKKFQEKGTQVRKFSERDLAQIEEWAWEIIVAEAQKNPDYDKVVTSIFQYMKDFSQLRDYEVPYSQGRNPLKWPKLPNLK